MTAWIFFGVDGAGIGAATLHLGLCGALNRRAVGWRRHTANRFGRNGCGISK